MDRKAEAKRAVSLLRSARSQGFLDPIFNELEKRIGGAEAPVEPEGPEWPYKRAIQDGVAAGLIDFSKWLDVRSTIRSPDGAENTED